MVLPIDGWPKVMTKIAVYLGRGGNRFIDYMIVLKLIPELHPMPSLC